MKQKDFALIAVVIVISVVFSLVLSNAVIGSPKKNQLKAADVDALSASFPLPDEKYFNDKSLDPTQTIQIGNANNPDPFKGSDQ